MRRLPLDRYERETVGLVLVPWLCALLLVAALAVPFLGWANGTLVSLGGAAAVLLVCYLACARRLPRRLETTRPGVRR